LAEKISSIGKVRLAVMGTTMIWATKTRRNADYIYHLNSHAHYDFFTGETVDGGQVIFGAKEGNILRLIFDRAGRYKETVRIKLPSKVDVDLRQRFPEDEYPELAEIMEDEQIIERDISMYRFFDRENNVGITDLPDTYVDYLGNEGDYLAGESEEIRKREKDWIESEIERWKKRGDYVFWWDNDYYVNELGEVVSS
jgi:hypothetical protein